jgi:peptidyl-tRNA hydrolase
VRKDLPPGAMLAQSCHVAFRFATEWRCATNDWLDTSEYICILATENETELLELWQRAQQLEIPSESFREPDYNDSLTAIALAPGEKSKKLCSNLPLALKG